MNRYLAIAGLVILLGVGGYFVWENNKRVPITSDVQASDGNPALPEIVTLKPGESVISEDKSRELTFRRIIAADPLEPEKDGFAGGPEFVYRNRSKTLLFFVYPNDVRLYIDGPAGTFTRCEDDMGDVIILPINVDLPNKTVTLQVKPVSRDEVVQWCQSQPG